MSLEKKYTESFESSRATYQEMLAAIDLGQEEKADELKSKVKSLKSEQNAIRDEVKSLIVKNDPAAETRDTDYVFMRFVMDYLPPGIVGLLFAVIFSAAMSSSSSELNALGSTTTIDLYKRSIKKEASDGHYVLSLS